MNQSVTARAGDIAQPTARAWLSRCKHAVTRPLALPHYLSYSLIIKCNINNASLRSFHSINAFRKSYSLSVCCTLIFTVIWPNMLRTSNWVILRRKINLTVKRPAPKSIKRNRTWKWTVEDIWSSSGESSAHPRHCSKDRLSLSPLARHSPIFEKRDE